MPTRLFYSTGRESIVQLELWEIGSILQYANMHEFPFLILPGKERYFLVDPKTVKALQPCD